MKHKDLQQIHRMENWVYPNEAARTGATGLLAEDIGKVAYQTDSETYWRLKNHSPVTWGAIGGGGGGGGGSDSGRGLRYHFDHTNTTPGDPGAGKFIFNAGQDHIYISETDADGQSWGVFFNLQATKNFIIVRDRATPFDKWALFVVSASVVRHAPDYCDIPFDWYDQSFPSWLLAADADVFIEFIGVSTSI
jgi:hypothetical protein